MSGFRSVLLFAALLVFAGCGESQEGPPLVPVKGQVTIDGKPADAVDVTFIPMEGVPGNGGSGRTDAQGEYTLKTSDGGEGVPAGKYRVVLHRLLMPDGSPLPLGSNVAPMDSPARESLPPEYSSQESSKQQATVTPGPSEPINFQINLPK